MDCSNYRGISLLSIPSTVYTHKDAATKTKAPCTCRRNSGRGTIKPDLGREEEQWSDGPDFFITRQLSEKFPEKNRTLYNNFVDYQQAFDSMWQCSQAMAIAELWYTRKTSDVTRGYTARN